MPANNSKLTSSEEVLRNSTRNTQTGIQEMFDKTTSKAEELFSEASKSLEKVE